MSKVAQIIIVILFLLLGGSVFMVLTTLNQKQALEKEKSDLENQLTQSQTRETKLITDSKKFETDLKTAEDLKAKLQKDMTAAQDQVDGLNEKITSISKERDDWKDRVEAIRKERDDLMAKLQSKPEQPQIVSAPQPPPPQAEPVAQETGEAPVAQTASAVPSSTDERYWADVLKEKADLALQVEKFKSELTSKLVEIEELKGKNSDLEMQLTSFTRDKEDIQQQIKYGEDLANNLSMELARTKNDRKFVADRFKKLEDENTNLRTQIKGLSATKMALEKSIARLNEDKSAVQKKLTQTEGLVQGRIDDIWEIKDSLDKTIKDTRSMPTTGASNSNEVELPPIIVNAQGPAISEDASYSENEAPGFNGKVVSINDENNFVIVDLGENSGVKLGDALAVYRGAQYIAGLEVIQVRRDISAADIKEKGAKIKVGDVVK